MPIPSSYTDRPEHRILLFCASRAQDLRAKETFAGLLVPELDWAYLVEILRRNYILSMFIYHMKGHETSVPEAVIQTIRPETTYNLQRRLVLFVELSQVVKLLAENGVPVLAYKGPALAYTAYGSLALRPFLDLDLLINRRDRALFLAVLEANGYEREIEDVLPPHLQEKRDTIEHEMTLFPTQAISQLDVHWEVTAPYDLFPLPFEAMWERRVPVKAAPEMYAPCREDLLLALCIHGIKHVWQRLEWIASLKAIVQSSEQEPLNWSLLEASPAMVSNRRIVLLGLCLAMDLGRVDGGIDITELVPAYLRRQIAADAMIGKLSTQVWTMLFQEERSPEAFFSIPQFLFSIRVRDNFPRRLAYVRAVIRAYLVPHQEDAGSRSMTGIYLRRVGRIISRRLRRLLVLRRI